MNLLRSLRKPEYVFRPLQVIRRLSREMAEAHKFEQVILPWGLPIRVRPAETIGSCIWRVGIYDLCVSECLWRLLDVGETALDVGANIGHMTGLMALRAGRNGRVVALEPHPEIAAELKYNASCWSSVAGLGQIEILEVAASTRVGRSRLYMPELFESNRGLASLELPGEQARHICEVTLTTLDEVVPVGTTIGVMKLDVEGHELPVLHGGRRLIESRAVRDIVFEEHVTPPTPVTQYLERCGYEVFHLDVGFLGPKMISIASSRVRYRSDAPSCLATIAPKRAIQRLRTRAWQVLGKRKTPVCA